MKLVPYPHQLEAAQWLLSLRRAVLGSDMGTMKTGSCCIAAKKKYEETGLPVFVIGIVSILKNWERELDIWWPEAKVRIVKSSTQKFDKHNVYIFTYQRFWRMISKLPKCCVLICDEAHAMCNPDAKQTIGPLMHFQRLHPGHKFSTWLVTGTPFPNCIANSWTLFNFCAFGKLGKYWEYAGYYGYIRETPYGDKPSGTRRNRLPELMELVRPFLRRDSAELLNLPPYEDIELPLEPSDRVKPLLEEGEKYRAAMARLLGGEGGDEDSDDEEVQALSTLRMELAKLKLLDCLEHIENTLDQGEQVVIYMFHRDAVDIMVDKLSERWNVASIRGGQSANSREAVIQAFQKRELDAVVLNIRAGGTGINLQCAHIVYFVEGSFSAGETDQAKRRVLRPGQTKRCLYYFPFYPDTIDEMPLTSIKSKSRNIEVTWDAFNGVYKPKEAIEWDDTPDEV